MHSVFTDIPPQAKTSVEKVKVALEQEIADLSTDVHSLTSSKQEMEHKRKKLEGQLADLQSRYTDSERQRAELGERVSKTTVSSQKTASWKINCVAV